MQRRLGPRSAAKPGSRADRLTRFIYGSDKADLAVGYDDDKTRAIDAILLGADDPTTGLNWRVVWVAAAGFLTDSYNLFASNVVLPALTFVYWDDSSKGRQYGFNIATLLGSMLGQVIFGFAVDIWGRRALYGLELAIVIISTLGLLQCSLGYRDDDGSTTWSIDPWLFCWRVAMGCGIGAEYPLSATIAAEWSSKHSRARMMSVIFLMQPIGQLLAYIIGLIAITHVSSSNKDIDKFWRIVIGVGAIPTLLALLARPFLPESWRFTYFVVQNELKAQADLSRVYGNSNSVVTHHRTDAEAQQVNGNAVHPNVDTIDHAPAVQATAGPAPNGHMANGHIEGEHAVPAQVVNRIYSEASSSSAWRPGDQFREGRFWHFLCQPENRKKLLGTSICWFLLDFAFYGVGFNSPGNLAKLWTDSDQTFARNAPWWQTTSVVTSYNQTGYPDVVNGVAPDGSIPRWTINEIIKQNVQNAIYTTQIAAILGSLVFIFTSHLLNRRRMLIGTFFAVAVVLAAIAGSFKQLFHDGVDGSAPVKGGHIILIALWALAMFLFNFGPNTLTFILPAEIFPTRYRCTCYGIAACAGKAGAVVVQGVIWGVKSDPNNYMSLQGLMAGFSVIMALGGLCAMIPGWIPDVQDGLESKSLEELSDDQMFIQRPRRDDDSQ